MSRDGARLQVYTGTMTHSQLLVVRGVFESAELARLVGRILARHRFSLQLWEPPRGDDVAPTYEPIVVDVGAYAAFTRVAGTVAVSPPVLVGGPATGGPVAEREAARPDTAPVPHRLPEDEEKFVRSVRWAWVDGAEARVNAAMGQTTAPAPVRAALRLVLSQRPPQIARRKGEARRSPLRWMAEEVGCSPDYLSRASAACGVPLRRVSDLWMLLLATVLRRELGTWEAVAGRLGYRSTSGLSALVERCAGPGGLRQFERSSRADPERIVRLLLKAGLPNREERSRKK